ncbi:MAG: hypothetical protein M0R51_11650 [Clostridia bacterium]|jgi:hypothetical protein|nr:hypothetical protein [Clostridia bacterium]
MNEMSNKDAEEAYKTGHTRLNNDKNDKASDVSRFVPDGFYDKELTFEAWLKRYNIKII